MTFLEMLLLGGMIALVMTVVLVVFSIAVAVLVRAGLIDVDEIR